MEADVREFMSLLFASRDFAHKAHLNTDSYAQHQALGSIYTGLICLADSFAEAWMGRNLEKIGDITISKSPDGDPLVILQRHLKVLEDTRNFVGKDDSALNNIIDEIVSLYLSTIYKLKFLG